jgi:hypothetical protein
VPSWSQRLGQELCDAYVKWRIAQRDARATKSVGRNIKPSIARRELVTEPRERYLKRDEVARLLWAALGFDRKGKRNQFRINRHLARFILVGLYTGTSPF